MYLPFHISGSDFIRKVIVDSPGCSFGKIALSLHEKKNQIVGAFWICTLDGWSFIHKVDLPAHISEDEVFGTLLRVVFEKMKRKESDTSSFESALERLGKSAGISSKMFKRKYRLARGLVAVFSLRVPWRSYI